jgi:hypothetical protein
MAPGYEIIKMRRMYNHYCTVTPPASGRRPGSDTMEMRRYDHKIRTKIGILVVL